MKVNEIMIAIGLLVPILIAIPAYGMAKKRNRLGWLWFINCYFTGLIGLLVLYLSKKLKPKEIQTLPYSKREIEIIDPDVLGWVILFVGLFIFVLQILLGYSLAEEYHRQMFWNYHNSLIMGY